MRKFLFSLCFIFIPMLSVAENVEIDGIRYNLIGKANVAEVINKPNDYSGDVVIPEKIVYENKTYDVTTISENAFAYCPNLNSVIIPASIKSIGNRAFEQCGISSIEIPNTVTSIGTSIFNGCKKLAKANIPTSVTEINYGMFWGCTALGSIVIPDNITKIGEGAFFNCPLIKEIRIPDSVTEIADQAFGMCIGLTSVVIPNSVKKIGASIFAGCIGLKEVTLPEGLTEIPGGFFHNCPSITSFSIPEGIISIGGSAFSNCTGISEMEVPEGVTSIEQWAFSNCTNLKTIKLPKSLKSLGHAVFLNCTSLTNIDISDIGAWCSIQFYDESARVAENLLLNGQLIVNLEIPDGIETIPSNAFNGKKHIETIRMPQSVTLVGYRAFQNCSALREVSFSEAIISINEEAFSNCSGLTEITIPNSCQQLNSCCFEGCSSLKSVRIQDNVNFIGRRAFSGCSSLETLYIGSGVNSIDGDAFAICEQLKDVYCYAYNVPYCSYPIFEGSKIEYATLHVPALSYNDYIASDKWNKFGTIEKIIDPDHIEVGDFCYAFNKEEKTATLNSHPRKKYYGKIIIPQTVEYDGDVYNVSAIGQEAFSNCRELLSVDMKEGITSIGINAFSGCVCLEKIEIPEGVSTIKTGTFAECTTLSVVSLPQSLTSIGEAAFFNCYSLRALELPKNVAKIDNFAFNNCHNLREITANPATPPAAEAESFPYENITLKVSEASKNLYASTSPWNRCIIQTFSGEDVSKTKCDNPRIKYNKGMLSFESDMEDVEYHYSIKDSDIKDGNGNNVALAVTYNISVYATKAGFDPSDVVTATLCWIDVDPKTEGITNDVASVRAKAIMIQSNDGGLNIFGAPEGSMINVYDLSGKIVGSAKAGAETTIIPTSLNSGEVGIVKIADKSIKISIK